ncbi:WhiB family transcriptional regulator [Streptomyces sp. NPDC057654]|uniref:WhiB family transcriptional regulator n=1 Tax=Streptomyces sp. NPDC057654 TaxID=3346196 RepID=UPI00367A120B
MNSPALRLSAQSISCTTTDPEVFHDHRHEVLAKRLCGKRPLKEICWACAREQREWGIWGGEDNKERALAGHPPHARGGEHMSRELHPERGATSEPMPS